MTKSNLYVVFPPARSSEVKNTLSGIVDALSHHPAWAGALATSELDQRVVFRSEPPFGTGALVGEAVRDRDIDQIRLWFEDVTVNHGDYLRDTTGNRRFWVVRCEDTLDTSGLSAARDALWAEAAHCFLRGEAWHLDPEHEAGMRDEHDARLEHDPWEEVLEAWTSSRTTETGELPFSMTELLELGLGVPAQSQNPRVTARVSRVLARLGYRKRKRSSLPRTYFYARKPEVAGLPSCRPPSSEEISSVTTSPLQGDCP